MKLIYTLIVALLGHCMVSNVLYEKICISCDMLEYGGENIVLVNEPSECSHTAIQGISWHVS